MGDAALPERLPESGESTLLGSVLAARYRVLRRLGEGAIGRVYEVEHLQIGGHFALKLLKSEHAHASDVVERFRREAKLGARLLSPHTVTVFDFDLHDGLPFLVMEYLEGVTLQKLLAREGVLSVPRTVRLLRDACSGTQAAHAIGILHRDLKPSNLFVCQGRYGESCKVLDFGIAKHTEKYLSSSVGPSTSTGAILGTLAYMPPEQIRGEQSLDERADVYSLGAILYECLSGRRLYEAGTPPALMYKILEEEPVSLSILRPDLPRALVECVERAICRRPDERYDGVFALEQALLAGVPKPESALTLHDDATQTDASTSDLRATVAQELPAAGNKPVPRTVLIALGAAGFGLLVGRGFAPGTPPAVDGPQERASTAPGRSSAPQVVPFEPPTPAAGEPSALSPPVSAAATSSVAPRPAPRLPAIRPPLTPTGSARAAPSAAPLPSSRDLRMHFDRSNPYLDEP